MLRCEGCSCSRSPCWKRPAYHLLTLAPDIAIRYRSYTVNIGRVAMVRWYRRLPYTKTGGSGRSGRAGACGGRRCHTRISMSSSPTPHSRPCLMRWLSLNRLHHSGAAMPKRSESVSTEVGFQACASDQPLLFQRSRRNSFTGSINSVTGILAVATRCLFHYNAFLT